MDKYVVEITDEALADMAGIYNYIANTLLAPENAMGYSELCDDEVELRQYLQRVADNTNFTAWYFGHFHDDTEVEDTFFCLYDEVVKI